MKTFKKVLSFLIVFVMISSLAACGERNESKEIINYADAESFEAALNKGENLEGKIVQFIAKELHPDSALGYNIWAGEHLNFVSSGNPDVKEGDTVVVKAATIESILGSWVINYEKVNNAVIDDFTISFSDADISDLSGETSENRETMEYVDMVDSDSPADSSGVASFAVDNSSTSAQPLELVDYGWYINSPSGDTAYVDFCGMIYNPNEKLVAEFPKVIVTVKNGDGSIVATEEQTGSIIMPNDTVTLCGMFSVPVTGLTEDAQIFFDVDWSELGSGTSFYSAAKTTDFTITNVSERNGSDENFITGEITNNFSEDIDQVNLSIVLRKDGKIVYMENTFLDSLKVGKSKAFQIQRYSAWPEHDTIDVSAMVW